MISSELYVIRRQTEKLSEIEMTSAASMHEAGKKPWPLNLGANDERCQCPLCEGRQWLDWRDADDVKVMP